MFPPRRVKCFQQSSKQVQSHNYLLLVILNNHSYFCLQNYSHILSVFGGINLHNNAVNFVFDDQNFSDKSYCRVLVKLAAELVIFPPQRQGCDGPGNRAW